LLFDIVFCTVFPPPCLPPLFHVPQVLAISCTLRLYGPYGMFRHLLVCSWLHMYIYMYCMILYNYIYIIILYIYYIIYVVLRFWPCCCIMLRLSMFWQKEHIWTPSTSKAPHINIEQHGGITSRGSPSGPSCSRGCHPCRPVGRTSRAIGKLQAWLSSFQPGPGLKILKLKEIPMFCVYTMFIPCLYPQDLLRPVESSNFSPISTPGHMRCQSCHKSPTESCQLRRCAQGCRC
jgi:hypothetical protein